MNARPARKRFGQHFLEPAGVVKVLRAIEPHAAETFLEIGPGRGALTRPLTSSAACVLGFEIDRDLASDLREAGLPNLTVAEGDFLDVTADRLREELTRAAGHARRSSSVPAPLAQVRVAGNLPYNVASPILFKLVELYAAGLPLVDATVMLQREVADRLLAEPGTRQYGVLSVLIKLWADVDRRLSLPPGAFRPSPKIHSALVRLRFHQPASPPIDPQIFTALTQAIFTRRRKTLANALLAFPLSARLSPATALDRAGIDGRRRPETVTIAELVHLADVFAVTAAG